MTKCSCHPPSSARCPARRRNTLAGALPLLALLAAFVLAACGGGSGGSETPPPGSGAGGGGAGGCGGSPAAVSGYDALLHVDGSCGADTNDGSAGSPLATLQAALTAGEALIAGGSTAVAVLVAAGTYTVNSNAGVDTHIVLREGVSLLGGYATGDWSVRDPAANPTIIDDVATAATGGCGAYNVTCAVMAPWPGDGAPKVTDATLLTGFVVKGAAAANARGIFVAWDAHPTLRGNTVILKDSTEASPGVNAAIYAIEPGAPFTIEDNTVVAGSHDLVNIEVDGISVEGLNGGSTTVTIRGNTIQNGVARSTYGMYLSDLAGGVLTDNTVLPSNGSGYVKYGVYLFRGGANGILVERNHIHAGDNSGNDVLGFSADLVADITLRNNVLRAGNNPASGANAALTLSSSNGSVLNNTLIGGSAANMNALTLWGTSSVAVENNILYGGGTAGYCVDQSQSPAAASTLKNNVFRACGDALLSDDAADKTTRVDMEALSAEYSGNLEDDPGFADFAGGNLHLTPSSPATVRTGGLDLSAQFTDDADGNPRSVPFSIGAYEQN